ncbi:MAG: HAMP domain-containing protein [Elusimicrobia bacterium]|nr:HAMP domain-containing protein [Elusimicrobiota bacterium]
MRIRSKVILFVLLFLTVSGAAMAWCYLNIRREEAAFLENRRAMKTLAALTDIEYFLVRQVRLLENYVLLGDESERLQLVQAVTQTRQRLDDWDKAAQRGESNGSERVAVQQVHETIAKSSNKIRGLLAANKRVQAMALTEKEFTPVSARALEAFGSIKQRVQIAKEEAESRVSLELRFSHMGLLGGLGLVSFFGLVSLLALYRTVIRPIQSMKNWADRVARGEKAVPLAGFKGANELTELAQSIGEMAIQLTRPKAYPPPLPTTVPSVTNAASLAAPTPASSLASAISLAGESSAATGASPKSVASGSTPKGSIPPTPTTDSIGQVLPAPTPEKLSASPPKSGVEAGSAKGAEAPVPSDVKDGFEVAVDEFRDLLTQLSGKPPAK